MTRNYENWERLVAAVVKKQQLWELFHEQSRSPSISSESSSSGFSFSFHQSSSLDDYLPIGFYSSPDFAPARHKDRENDDNKGTPSSILVVEDQSPKKNVILSTRPRKRDLKIEVPKLRISFDNDNCPHASQNCSNISPKIAILTPVSRRNHRTRGGQSETQSNWPDDDARECYPLPLPPVTMPNSSPFSRPSSTATSPSSVLPRSPENVTSPGSSWKKGKRLGRGMFGDVYIGFNSETGEMCAMKEITLFPDDDAKSRLSAMQFGTEIAVLSSFRHPNIVQYYGFETVGDKLYIYLEYVSGGSIYNILQQYGKLGESAIRSYTQQILAALAYLHSKSTPHRDIRGTNILVDPSGIIKLANFGIEKHIAEQSSPSLDTASFYWMAPEVIMNPNMRTQAIDIWSLGCTVLEMATSRPPMINYGGVVPMFKGLHRNLPTVPDHLSDECKDFLKHCLQWNPSHRATASLLLNHPFVKQVPGSAILSHPALAYGVNPVLNSRELAADSSRASKSKFHSSDVYTPRNLSSPVSPVGSPLPYPRSPQHPTGMKSPPPISSSRATSGSPTPLTGGTGATSYYPRLPQDTLYNIPKRPTNMNSPSYWDHNILRGTHLVSHVSSELQSHNNDFFGKPLGGTANEQLVLADRVSQRLLGAPVKLSPSLDLNQFSRFPNNKKGGV